MGSEVVQEDGCSPIGILPLPVTTTVGRYSGGGTGRPGAPPPRCPPDSTDPHRTAALEAQRLASVLPCPAMPCLHCPARHHDTSTPQHHDTPIAGGWCSGHVEVASATRLHLSLATGLSKGSHYRLQGGDGPSPSPLIRGAWLLNIPPSTLPIHMAPAKRGQSRGSAGQPCRVEWTS